jgi:hypothetical protein
MVIKQINQTKYTIFGFGLICSIPQAILPYFSLYVESRLIYFPKVIQIFPFTLFIYKIFLSKLFGL